MREDTKWALHTDHRGREEDVPSMTTKYGLPIDHGFGKVASEEQLQNAASALREHQIKVEIVSSVADARSLLNEKLPHDQVILTTSSETLRTSGLFDDINSSGRFTSLRQRLSKMDAQTQFPEMRMLGAGPEVVVGSVHAVTETGELVIASATGSQLAPYASGAGKAIWVVGGQKVVPDLVTAMKRIQYYSYPMEDVRSREATGKPSSIIKILIIHKELMANRGMVVLIREAIGF